MSKPSHVTLLLRHIRYSISYGRYKYISFFTFLIFLVFMTSLKLKASGSNSLEIFYELLKDTGYFLEIKDYKIPFNWELIQFFTLFLIGDFLFHDYKHNRGYLLTRCRSKVQYICSYMSWIIVQNVLLFGCIFFVIYVVSSAVMGTFFVEGSPFMKDFLQAELAMQITAKELILRMFIGYAMTGIVLSTLQLFGMQFTTATITFFGTILLAGLSTFLNNQWLPAIHSMILKQAIFDKKHHLTLQTSVVHSVVLYIVAVVVIVFVFRKKDIV